MLKDLLEPIVLNRMLNAVLLMFVATVFWSWLTPLCQPSCPVGDFA
jgi:hypothetical protein